MLQVDAQDSHFVNFQWDLTRYEVPQWAVPPNVVHSLDGVPLSAQLPHVEGNNWVTHCDEDDFQVPSQAHGFLLAEDFQWAVPRNPDAHYSQWVGLQQEFIQDAHYEVPVDFLLLAGVLALQAVTHSHYEALQWAHDAPVPLDGVQSLNELHAIAPQWASVLRQVGFPSVVQPHALLVGHAPQQLVH